MSGTSSLQPQEEGLTLFFCEAVWATVIAYIVCRVSRTALKSSRSFSFGTGLYVRQFMAWGISIIKHTQRDIYRPTHICVSCVYKCICAYGQTYNYIYDMYFQGNINQYISWWLSKHPQCYLFLLPPSLCIVLLYSLFCSFLFSHS